MCEVTEVRSGHTGKREGQVRCLVDLFGFFCFLLCLLFIGCCCKCLFSNYIGSVLLLFFPFVCLFLCSPLIFFFFFFFIKLCIFQTFLFLYIYFLFRFLLLFI